MPTAECKQSSQCKDRWKLTREYNILLYPISLAEFAKCHCLILAGLGEVKSGPQVKSEILDKGAHFGIIVLFIYNKIPGQEDKLQCKWIVGNMSFPPGILEIL